MQAAPVERLAGAILHVGCGGNPLPKEIAPHGVETRLDIDPACKPNIVASATDMGEIGPFDIVYSSHCLEHLSPHDVDRALAEMCRVLVPGGCVLAIVPNLEGIKPTTEVVYVSPSGPITGRDMFYGHADLVDSMPFMAHRTGFVADTLKDTMERAGLLHVSVQRDTGFNLIAMGIKP